MSYNYYRDVWALLNSMKGYPGAFLVGFIRNVKQYEKIGFCRLPLILSINKSKWAITCNI